MGKLIGRYRLGSKLLKIYEAGNGLRGVLYKFVWNTTVSPNKYRLEKQESASFNSNSEAVVKQQFGMAYARPVWSDSLINVNHRVIWTNNDYEEWKACMLEDGYTEEDCELDRYYDDCVNNLWDERANLDVPVDGVIVAFADLGLWDGRHNGAKVVGRYVKNILHSGNDYQNWYCDRFNVRCDDIHHDGTNFLLYRVAKSEEQAKKLVQAIAYEDMTEEQFRKATRSLRPYVAKVYGW